MFLLDVTLGLLSIKHEWVYLFVHTVQFNVESRTLFLILTHGNRKQGMSLISVCLHSNYSLVARSVCVLAGVCRHVSALYKDQMLL